MQDDSVSPLTAFLEASINFKNEEVFILYAIMLFISTLICLILFSQKQMKNIAMTIFFLP